MSDERYFKDLIKSLNDVGFYSYTEDCFGLTQKECRTLTELCDKAMEGIVRWLDENES